MFVRGKMGWMKIRYDLLLPASSDNQMYGKTRPKMPFFEVVESVFRLKTNYSLSRVLSSFCHFFFSL